MNFRNNSAVDARPLQSEFLDEPARWDSLRILEHTTGARRGGLRTPPLLAAFVHQFLNVGAFAGNSAQRGRQGDMCFKESARTIFAMDQRSRRVHNDAAR